MSSAKQSQKSDSKSDAGDKRTVNLLRKINSGAVNPTSISASDRRQLVEFLMNDGYSTAETGEILQVADRTIERDKKAIRERNAISRDPKLVEKIVGQLIGEVELSVQRIRRAVRGKDVPPETKIDASYRCCQIRSDLVQRLQGLGYLPTASQKFEADLTHHMGEVPGFEAMHAEVQRLKQIHQQTDGEDPQALLLLEQQIEQADLATQVDEASSQAENMERDSDDDE